MTAPDKLFGVFHDVHLLLLVDTMLASQSASIKMGWPDAYCRAAWRARCAAPSAPHRGRAATARGVLAQRIDTAGEEALAPHRNLAPAQASFDGDALVLSTLSSEQNDQRSLLQPGLHRAALCKPAKLPQGVLVQLDRLGNSHSSSLLKRLSMPMTVSSITSRALH